jgi:hypothetical protein
MAVKLLVPWLGFKPGDIIDRGEATDIKLLAAKKAERVTVKREPVEKAVIRPKEVRNGRN